MQSLVEKLNILMNELNNLLQASDMDTGLFQLQCSNSDPMRFMLTKVTRQGKLLLVAFNKIPGIKVELVHKGNKTTLCLTEKAKNAFKELDENFNQIALLIKNKILEDCNVVKGASVLSLSAPALMQTSSRSTHFYRLNDQTDEIDLNFINSYFITAAEIQNFQRKIQGKKLTSLSICYNQLSTTPFDLFASLTDLIAHADVRILMLKEADLGGLDSKRAQLFFNALNNKSLREVNLDNNHLETLMTRHPEILNDFLGNASIQSLSLKNNNISDASGTVLAKNCRIQNIDLSNNNLSDESSSCFEKNPHFIRLNFFANHTTRESINKIDQALLSNKRKAYVETVTVLAQGLKVPESPIARLPKDILFEILAYLGNEFKSPYNVKHLCTLLINNILASSPGHLVWNKKLKTPLRLFPVFKSSNAEQDTQKSNNIESLNLSI